MGNFRVRHRGQRHSPWEGYRDLVKFTNLGKPTIVTLDLVAIKNEWRIRNITWQIDGKSQTLRGIYGH